MLTGQSVADRFVQGQKLPDSRRGALAARQRNFHVGRCRERVSNVQRRFVHSRIKVDGQVGLRTKDAILRRPAQFDHRALSRQQPMCAGIDVDGCHTCGQQACVVPKPVKCIHGLVARRHRLVAAMPIAAVAGGSHEPGRDYAVGEVNHSHVGRDIHVFFAANGHDLPIADDDNPVVDCLR